MKEILKPSIDFKEALKNIPSCIGNYFECKKDEHCEHSEDCWWIALDKKEGIR